MKPKNMFLFAVCLILLIFVYISASHQIPVVGVSNSTIKGYMEHGYYYTISGQSIVSEGRLMSSNDLQAAPIYIPNIITIKNMSVYVMTAGGENSTLRMGIYKSSGIPTSLVIDAGNISASTTGVKTITINQTLNPGNYFLAIVAQNNATNRPIVRSIYYNGDLLPNPLNNTYMRSSFNQYSISGALPITYSTTPSLDAEDFPLLQIGIQ